MDDSERIDHLIGQVATLKAFSMCIALLHDRPVELQKGFEKFSEITMAQMLPTAASESMLEGVEYIKTALAAVLQDAVERHETLGKS